MVLCVQQETCVHVVQYLSQARDVRSKKEKFAPEAFGFLVVYCFLLVSASILLILTSSLSHRKQIPIQPNNLRLEILRPRLLCQRRLLHCRALHRIGSI